MAQLYNIYQRIGHTRGTSQSVEPKLWPFYNPCGTWSGWRNANGSHWIWWSHGNQGQYINTTDAYNLGSIWSEYFPQEISSYVIEIGHILATHKRQAKMISIFLSVRFLFERSVLCPWCPMWWHTRKVDCNKNKKHNNKNNKAQT